MALGVVLLAAGCSVAPSETIGVQPSPKVTSTPGQSSLPPTAFEIDEAYGFGVLPDTAAHVACSDNDHKVEISGLVQGAKVVVTLTHLRAGQRLTDPPIGGGFSDQVTMRVTPTGSQPPLTYEAGYENGVYQGAGSLTVDKSGRSGSFGISFGAPVGQSPSQQTSGNQTLFGGNEGNISGSWTCP